MPKLLIVDDNADNRDYLSRRLQRRGFNVVLAVDGQDAVDKTRSEKPDLVLMDMNMPVLDGWQATGMIRADPDIQKIPVIGLTAHAMEGDKQKALEAGCDDYHTKPIDFAGLLTQIETLLKKAAGS